MTHMTHMTHFPIRQRKIFWGLYREMQHVRHTIGERLMKSMKSPDALSGHDAYDAESGTFPQTLTTAGKKGTSAMTLTDWLLAIVAGLLVTWAAVVIGFVLASLWRRT